MKNYIISISNINNTHIYLFKILLLIAINIFPRDVVANSTNIYDLKPWSVLFYGGGTAKQTFGDVILGKYTSFGEIIYATELAYTFDHNNLIRRFFKSVFDVVQLAGNIVYRHDYRHHDNVKEGNLYLIWRFTRFPWSSYLRNSVAIGDGISYDSHPPFADRLPEKPASDFANLLNYMVLEITFALPSHPEFELALRLHHRCTAWGIYPKNRSAGSTNVGIGVRYYF
ncbi:MAG: hypothetical protein LBL17_02940 [Coxiellaceae bacterium]|jgi:hypothetical protein|nr:hypothetical protein [Coxiellaceae bacterium]